MFKGLADRFRPELGEDCLQGANPRRQGIAVAVDGLGQEGDEGGGFVVQKVQGSSPRYGVAVPVAKAGRWRR